MDVWRLCSRRHASTAFSGEGARLYGGRWNPPGNAVVYCSESLSLAVLEALVHFDVSELPDDYVSIHATIPDQIKIIRYTIASLPGNWRSPGTNTALQTIGQKWASSKPSLVLAVPSAIIANEYNYLINPEHPDARLIEVKEVTPFTFDERLGS